MCTGPTVHRSNCTSKVTQPWLGHSEVGTYHNKRLLCEPRVAIHSCHTPAGNNHVPLRQSHCRLGSSLNANARED